MKVICIDASELQMDLVKEGEVYTVYEEEDVLFNIPVYFLEEIDTDGKKHPYDKKRFIPISDLDETTLVNEEFEEKYCETVK